MRLVTFSRAGTRQPEIGVRILRHGEDVAQGRILSLTDAARLAGAPALPATMRGLLADVTREGGFPPVLLQPIDFVALWQQRRAANETASATV